MSENGDLLFPIGGPKTLESSLSDFTEGKPAFIPFPSSQIIHGQSSEYKISFPPTMDTQIRKLKLSMEVWREVIIEANSILLWEKQWHSTALFLGSTALFSFLYTAEPSILSTLAFIGLWITVADCFLPTVLLSVFKADGWTKEKQKQYEEVCTNIIMYKTKIELVCASYYRMRTTNSKLYFTVTVFSLCLLIWMGGAIDNLLLMYLICTFLVMLPGMLHHGMLGKISDTFSKLFNELIENAKSKVGNGKKVQ